MYIKKKWYPYIRISLLNRIDRFRFFEFTYNVTVLTFGQVLSDITLDHNNRVTSTYTIAATIFGEHDFRWHRGHHRRVRDTIDPRGGGGVAYKYYYGRTGEPGSEYNDTRSCGIRFTLSRYSVECLNFAGGILSMYVWLLDSGYDIRTDQQISRFMKTRTDLWKLQRSEFRDS